MTNRAPEHIRTEMKHTRSEIAETVEELSDCLTPETLKRSAKLGIRSARKAAEKKLHDVPSRVSRGVENSGHSARNLLRENPIPTAIVGGILGLLVSRFAKAKPPRRETTSTPQERITP